MKKLAVLATLLVALFSTAAQAVIVNTLPYNLTNGSLADATQVMSNFNQIVNNANSNAAHNGANSDITSLTGLTTPLAPTYGGTVVYVGGTTAGSANAQTLTSVTPSAFALTAGNIVTAIAGNTNSGATTLNVNGQGATAVKIQISAGLAACAGGELVSGNAYVFYYDGTEFILVNPSIVYNSQLAKMAAGTFKANILVSAALPTDVTLTSAIDAAFGSSQGSLLYRGASAWTTLSAGTAGQVLLTGGAAANPLWNSANVYQHVTSSPTGTSNATGVMMGLAGSITPTSSGTILITLSGSQANSGGTGATTQLYYGTGSAPSNGASLTGNPVGNKPVIGGTGVANNAIVTGLTVGTTYWVDVALAAVGGGTTSLTQLSLSIDEIK